MTQTCTRCSRVNPADALYCYWDGSTLPGHDSNETAGPVGSRRFPSPFVFPSGKVCHNFDELALSCHQHWHEAKEIIQQGFLEGFLSGLGRADLAMAARQAAGYPDPDRGLDQFLSMLPTQALRPPRLEVEPLQINLGQMRVGEDRRFELHLNNQGMRLIFGTITRADCGWLMLGEPPGVREKLIDFGSELTIPVCVRGSRLRASHKPIEGRIIIDTNGGMAVVQVRVEVPVIPFPKGVLAGAVSPRQIASRTKAALKEAAALLEDGSVANWYKDNGWSYPVQAPSSSGLGAVQQFFEALGLTPPPPVEISETAVMLRGQVGQRLQHKLEVRASVNRPVWAHSISDQAWLEASRAKLDGRVATVPLLIRSVPDRPGETLQAQVTITCNGNQKFVVPVLLEIAGTPAAPGSGGLRPTRATPPLATFDEQPAPTWVPNPSGGFTPPPFPEQPLGELPFPVGSAQGAYAPRAPQEGDGEMVRSVFGVLVPVGLVIALLLTLIGVVASDLKTEPMVPLIGVAFHDGEPDKGYARHVPTQSMRFGIFALGSGPDDDIRLTFDKKGQTNNTCLRLDGKEERLFGDPTGVWDVLGESSWVDEHGRKHTGKRSVWAFDRSRTILVTQLVEIIRGEQSGELDTCLVRYVVQNRDRTAHRVDIRFLLDTFIGSNDGVPFTIPGEAGLCDDKKEFMKPEEVPDFIQALEHEDLANPGIVAHLKLKLGGRMEPPSRVILGAWPDPYLQVLASGISGQESGVKDQKSGGKIQKPKPRTQNLPRGPSTGWEVPVASMKSLWPYDSAVAIYWEPAEPLPPGGQYEVGFTYGLGKVASGGRLLLTLDGSFKPGGEFTVTALAANPKPGETLTLIVPRGLRLSGLTPAEQPIPLPAAHRRASPITWKVKSTNVGEHVIRVKSSEGGEQSQKLTIRGSSIFD